MAGDWIKMRTDLFTHPKVVRMASAMKADTLRTVGGLMSVWCLFDAHSEDGYLDGYTPDVLDQHLRWQGFARSMIDVGWLVESACGGLTLPRFDTHNGQSAKRRAQDADRKREVRKASASEADKTRTREEKRREEIEIPPTPRKREGERFEEFWSAWPKSERKQDKAKCLDHWKRNSLDELASAILQDIQTKRQTQKWAEGYIEAPLVYLRGKRWQDGVTPAPAAGTAEPMDWRSTQSGIRAKGVEIGIGDWDEAAFQTGQGEHFPAYRARVEAKVRELELPSIDPAGQRRIADLIGKAMKAGA